MEQTGPLIQRVSALLNGSTQDVEATLMDGYARALALERDRVRLERRFAELTRALADDRDSTLLPELRSLRERMSSTDDELSRLRAVLSAVRRRLAAASAAEAAESTVA